MPNLSDYDPAVKYGANLDVNVDLADIRDENNNEMLEMDSKTSAVNYLRIENAAAGTSVAITAQGDDTNVTMRLGGKGTGIVTFDSKAALTLTSLAGTLNSQAGVLTSAILNVSAMSAGGTTVAFRLTNDKIAATSVMFVNVGNGTNTGGNPYVAAVTPGAGDATVVVVNGTGTALNGTLTLSFLVL